MAEAKQTSNRRASRRRPPKGSTKVQCYRGQIGLGKNEAVSALDVSESGAALVVKTAFRPGDELEVNLEGIAHRRPIKKLATVVWCVPSDQGRFVIGVKFQGILPYADLNELTRL